MLRTFATAIVVAGVIVAALEASVLLDLRSFEFKYLFELFGAGGLVYVLALELGAVVLWVWALFEMRGVNLTRHSRRIVGPLLVIWTILLAIMADWVFVSKPLIVRVHSWFISDQDYRDTVRDANEYARRTGDLAQLSRPSQRIDEPTLSVMIARVAVNRPSELKAAPIGETLVRYGTKYDVDPIFLFALAYLDSFYGEATSGPIPIFRQLTGESFRDLVQIHLPAWFIESRIRVAFIENDWLVRIFGSNLGTKLRYAFQKATYDVSTDPFDTNIFSDLFLVLSRYPEEFPELVAHGEDEDDQLNSALRKSFHALEGVTLLEPYDQPYVHLKRDSAYYSKYRDDIITFGRAAFYKLQFDFDFAAKVQALVVKYYSQQYRADLGETVWANVPSQQQDALVAMLRDMFVPNIGRVGYNLYLLPELNCTPYGYVVSEAPSQIDRISDPNALWHPKHTEYLWAGATYKLASLAEVWRAATGEIFRAPPPTETISDAVAVLARNRARLSPAFAE